MYIYYIQFICIYYLYLFTYFIYYTVISKSCNTAQDFPGGIVNKNLPANAGYVGFIPGPGRFHTPQSN